MLSVGDAVRAHAHTKDNRPGVVLRVFTVDESPRVYIAFGTSKPPKVVTKPPPVFVDRTNHGFAALALDVPTWFKPNQALVFKADDAEIRVVGSCPDTLLQDIRELYGFR
jgi:hypothetical protein